MTPGPRIVLLGKQGAGKGTQAEELAAHYGVVHLSTGEMFRHSAETGSRVGIEAKEFMDRGELVPDETVIGAVEESLQRRDTTERGFVLDGFPRTHPQAVELDRLLGDRSLDVVVEIDVPDDVVKERMLARGREDDTEEAISRRLELYRQETEPLTDHYRARDLLTVIEGVGEVEDITKRLIMAIDDRLARAPR